MQDLVSNLAFFAVLIEKNLENKKVLQVKLAKMHCEKIVKVLTFA